MIGLYRAISAIYGKQKPLNFFVSWMITLCLLIVWFFEDTFEQIKYIFCPSDDTRQANPFHNLKDEENCWPQMFLYSKQDLLIRYTVSFSIFLICNSIFIWRLTQKFKYFFIGCRKICKSSSKTWCLCTNALF